MINGKELIAAANGHVDRTMAHTGETSQAYIRRVLTEASIEPNEAHALGQAMRDVRFVEASAFESETSDADKYAVGWLDGLIIGVRAALSAGSNREAQIDLIAPIIERMESRHPERVIAGAILDALALGPRSPSSDSLVVAMDRAGVVGDRANAYNSEPSHHGQAVRNAFWRGWDEHAAWLASTPHKDGLVRATAIREVIGFMPSPDQVQELADIYSHDQPLSDKELLQDLACWFDDLGRDFAPAGASDLQERVEAVQRRVKEGEEF